MNKTFVIAEAGANHNRNFEQAISLIDVALNAGANAVKFQTYSSETLYSKNTPDFAGHSNIPDLIKKIEIPRDWQPELKKYCDLKGIEFMSTPFDENAVQQLVDLNVKRLKIAGFESTDSRFVEMVASTGLPLVLSMGIGFQERHLLKVQKIVNKYNNDLTLLHCNNAYPTPMSEIDLNVVKDFHSRGFNIGLSDHTRSIYTPSFAVIAGASVIEKHFTLSNHLPGPDHPFAMEPSQLSEMIHLIREAEKSLLKIEGEYSNSEMKFVKARRSIVAKKEIKIGDTFTVDNITTKRPFLPNNISAENFEDLIGKKALNDYEFDDFIVGEKNEKN